MLVHATYKGHTRLKTPQLLLPIPRLQTNLNLALHRQHQYRTVFVCDGMTIRGKLQAYQLEATVAVPSLLLGEPSVDSVEIPFSLAVSAFWPSQNEDGLV